MDVEEHLIFTAPGMQRQEDCMFNIASTRFQARLGFSDPASKENKTKTQITAKQIIIKNPTHSQRLT
jgi:hypothetical protein